MKLPIYQIYDTYSKNMVVCTYASYSDALENLRIWNKTSKRFKVRLKYLKL